jgi:hypothetical protein
MAFDNTTYTKNEVTPYSWCISTNSAAASAARDFNPLDDIANAVYGVANVAALTVTQIAALNATNPLWQTLYNGGVPFAGAANVISAIYTACDVQVTTQSGTAITASGAPVAGFIGGTLTGAVNGAAAGNARISMTDLKLADGNTGTVQVRVAYRHSITG